VRPARTAVTLVDRAGSSGALLTITQVARALRVSRRTAIRMIVRGDLPWIRRRGRTVVPAGALRSVTMHPSMTDAAGGSR